jgi:hypothetical protein
MNFDDLMDAYEFVSSDSPFMNRAFISKETGEVYYHSEMGDFEALPDDIDDRSVYLSIPHKKELNLSKQLVLKFAEEYLPDDFELITSIFSRKGAYASFRILLENTDMLKTWYKFEEAKTEEALKNWCKENELDV